LTYVAEVAIKTIDPETEILTYYGAGYKKMRMEMEEAETFISNLSISNAYKQKLLELHQKIKDDASSLWTPGCNSEGDVQTKLQSTVFTLDTESASLLANVYYDYSIKEESKLSQKAEEKNDEEDVIDTENNSRKRKRANNSNDENSNSDMKVIYMEDHQHNKWGCDVAFKSLPWVVTKVIPNKQAFDHGIKEGWRIVKWKSFNIDKNNCAKFETELRNGNPGTITFDTKPFSRKEGTTIRAIKDFTTTGGKTINKNDIFVIKQHMELKYLIITKKDEPETTFRIYEQYFDKFIEIKSVSSISVTQQSQQIDDEIKKDDLKSIEDTINDNQHSNLESTSVPQESQKVDDKIKGGDPTSKEDTINLLKKPTSKYKENNDNQHSTIEISTADNRKFVQTFLTSKKPNETKINSDTSKENTMVNAKETGCEKPKFIQLSKADLQLDLEQNNTLSYESQVPEENKIEGKECVDTKTNFQWTPKLDKQLIDMKKNGDKWKNICIAIGCTANQVKSRWQRKIPESEKAKNTFDPALHKYIKVTHPFSTRTDEPINLNVDDVLLVKREDIDGDLEVDHPEENEWEKCQWISKIDFDKIESVSVCGYCKKQSTNGQFTQSTTTNHKLCHTCRKFEKKHNELIPRIDRAKRNGPRKHRPEISESSSNINLSENINQPFLKNLNDDCLNESINQFMLALSEKKGSYKPKVGDRLIVITVFVPAKVSKFDDFFEDEDIVLNVNDILIVEDVETDKDTVIVKTEHGVRCYLFEKDIENIKKAYEPKVGDQIRVIELFPAKNAIWENIPLSIGDTLMVKSVAKVTGIIRVTTEDGRYKNSLYEDKWIEPNKFGKIELVLQDDELIETSNYSPIINEDLTVVDILNEIWPSKYDKWKQILLEKKYYDIVEFNNTVLNNPNVFNKAILNDPEKFNDLKEHIKQYEAKKIDSVMNAIQYEFCNRAPIHNKNKLNETWQYNKYKQLILQNYEDVACFADNNDDKFSALKEQLILDKYEDMFIFDDDHKFNAVKEEMKTKAAKKIDVLMKYTQSCFE